VSDPILHLSISQSPVFLLNSRLDLFTAPHLRGGLFSRSYETILPNSLAVNHSSALVYSTRLPVSVYGTGCYNSAFLGSGFKQLSPHPVDSVYYPTLTSGSTYYSVSTRVLNPSVTFLARSRYGNVDPFAIRFAFRLPLRTRLTLI
jgi:hypothetical protein